MESAGMLRFTFFLLLGLAGCSLLVMFGPFVAFLFKDMRRKMEPKPVMATVLAIE